MVALSRPNTHVSGKYSINLLLRITKRALLASALFVEPAIPNLDRCGILLSIRRQNLSVDRNIAQKIVALLFRGDEVGFTHSFGIG